MTYSNCYLCITIDFVLFVDTMKKKEETEEGENIWMLLFFSIPFCWLRISELIDSSFSKTMSEDIPLWFDIVINLSVPQLSFIPNNLHIFRIFQYHETIRFSYVCKQERSRVKINGTCLVSAAAVENNIFLVFFARHTTASCLFVCQVR